MTTQLVCKIVSYGAWGARFANIDALRELFNGNEAIAEPLTGPKPAVIPANERRRAPLTVRLAVESSWQATEACPLTPEQLKSVFVSGYGDTDLTDYMCRVLASDNKQLSPTKFHNSVHNAPAGYWTISTNATQAANSVAGYTHSVSIALLEAMIQCQIESTPMLVTFYDAPVAATMRSILPNHSAFAGSLIICPAASPLAGTTVTANVGDKTGEWPPLSCDNPYLAELYSQNPAAKLLCILEKSLAGSSNKSALCLPLSDGSSISLEFS
ncbi:MAG TPA: beta-ketoacyl synthase chain length factor [Marinagarivorans sp.]